jgi:hypothetical protein
MKMEEAGSSETLIPADYTASHHKRTQSSSAAAWFRLF